METWVLIPSELSLVLSSSQSSSKRDHDDDLRVWSNQRIARGTKFFPLQGTVRMDKLAVFSRLDPSDIRHKFGCYDDITLVKPCSVRHCNWIRFLRVTTMLTSEVNLLGSKVQGQAVFETTRLVIPHTELVAYCINDFSDHCDDVTVQMAITVNNLHFYHTMGLLLEESPLDLSTSLLSNRTSPKVGTVIEDHKLLAQLPTSHELQMTLSQRRIPRERTLLPCEVCGKSFDRPSLLKRHMLTHTGEKPHSCDICGKGFSTSSSLNTHRRIHSGEKPHQCTICGKRFTASSNLYYHRMTHIKEKPHKCTFCSKSFSTPGDLKNHMYIHNGSWPLRCHICNRGFSRQTNLKNHLFLHSGNKPHVCELCNKRFAQAGNLRTHLRTHSGGLSDDCTSFEHTNNSSNNINSPNGYCHNFFSKSLSSSSIASSGNNNNNNRRLSSEAARLEPPSTLSQIEDSSHDGCSESSLEPALDFPENDSLDVVSPSTSSSSSSSSPETNCQVNNHPVPTGRSTKVLGALPVI